MQLNACGMALRVPGIMIGFTQAPDDLMTWGNALFAPIPDQPPESTNNPLTPAKVELGKKLFVEPRPSESHAISYHSCHNVGLASEEDAIAALESTLLTPYAPFDQYLEGGGNALTGDQPQVEFPMAAAAQHARHTATETMSSLAMAIGAIR